jgi:hypothetical protein
MTAAIIGEHDVFKVVESFTACSRTFVAYSEILAYRTEILVHFAF